MSVGVISFTIYILYQAATTVQYADVYQYHSLPPLSSDKPWGIFNIGSKGNTEYTIISKTLYYSPNDHDGVNHLIKVLCDTYPSINAIGAEDPSKINSLYESNLFDTWAAIEFKLNAEQIAVGQLVTSQTNISTVAYNIRMTPTNWGLSLSTSTFSDTDTIYNKQSTDADLFWSTGIFWL